MANLERTLFNILHPKEEDRYQSFFKKDLWSIDEFGALICGLDPTRLEEIRNEEALTHTLEEEQKATNAVRITKQFLTDFIETFKENPLATKFIGDDFYLSSGRYIRWIVEKNIKMSGRFLKSLPLNLLELIEAFSPVNTNLRNANIYTSKYHRAKLEVHVIALLRRIAPKKTHHVQIYNDPSIQNVLHSFKSCPNGRKWYQKKYVIQDWITPLNKNCPRGRPPKKST